MDTLLQEQLYARHPRVFSERMLSSSVSAMGWGIETGDGWYDLIDGLCIQLQCLTDEEGAPQIVATQVKEKHGSLRFYVRETDDRQAAMIRLAQELSLQICEVCGAPGAPRAVGRFHKTRCDTHAPP